MTDRILIFIPMYNCARQIDRVVAQLPGRIKPFIGAVLILDNGSTDGGPDVARDALRRTEGFRWIVGRNRQNYNLGGSHKVAFDYAIDHGFSHVIVLHGDDQANIDDFVEALHGGLHRRYDALLGARFMPGARLHGYSLYRIIGNYGLNILCGAMVRRWIADQGSGLNLYKTDYLKSRFYRPLADTLVFPNQMFFHGLMTNSSYRFVPISWREEDQTSNAKAFSQALQVLSLVWNRERVFETLKHRSPAGPYEFDVLHQG